MVVKRRKAAERKREILEHYYDVLIEHGFEATSVGKIAKAMDIHPSLIMHHFKTKKNMSLELVDVLIDKYEAPEFLQFERIEDPSDRFRVMLDTIFALEWSRTIDPGLHFGFYYMSFRDPEIKQRYRAMIRRFRDYVLDRLTEFKRAGIVRVDDLEQAADLMVTVMEGLEFHAQFLAEGEPFERFARFARDWMEGFLTGGEGNQVNRSLSGRAADA